MIDDMTPAEAGRGRGWAWRWVREGARGAVFMRPRIEGLQASPGFVLVLALLLVLSGIVLQRGTIEDAARFDWQAIGGGWLTTLLLLWACWTAARGRAASAAGAATLFGLLLVQELLIVVPLGLLYLAAMRWAPQAMPAGSDWLLWGLWIATVVWVALAAAVALWRHAPPHGWPRAAIVGTAALVAALQVWAPAPPYWSADEFQGEAERPRLDLTQQLIESQVRALPAALAALKPDRPGVVDLYALTFAPYADEDVFSREAGLVADVMRTRFDAQQRVMTLQNHARSAADTPWATPLNLRRAIEGVARKMNRDEDILFIHLTSHGARDGRLSASFWPLEVEPVTPKQLAAWLDEAGVRFRVISISACYSGSWIPPLAGPGTLVMTASDAEHTSYGCGRKSELTFFGRAMYDEQLRSTRSFEAAHAAVRPVIERREKEAGKSDGFSNPQIAVGEAIRDPLARLAQRLEAGAGVR